MVYSILVKLLQDFLGKKNEVACIDTFDPQLSQWLTALLTKAVFSSPDPVNGLAEGSASRGF